MEFHTDDVYHHKTLVKLESLQGRSLNNSIGAKL